MKHWGKYIPILALLAVGLFTAAPAAAQTGSVTGTILDASSGQPLDAVQVSLEAVGTVGGAVGSFRNRSMVPVRKTRWAASKGSAEPAIPAITSF